MEEVVQGERPHLPGQALQSGKSVFLVRLLLSVIEAIIVSIGQMFIFI